MMWGCMEVRLREVERGWEVWSEGGTGARASRADSRILLIVLARRAVCVSVSLGPAGRHMRYVTVN